jgi:hypothetical protein
VLAVNLTFGLAIANSYEMSWSMMPKKIIGRPRAKLNPEYTHESYMDVPESAV